MNVDFNEIALFKIDDAFYGIDIRFIQEINKNLAFTKTYNSPDYIKGIINLRGQIVTVIDLRIKFGFPPKSLAPTSRIIVVKNRGENIGILVDSIEDIIEVDQTRFENTAVKIERVDSGYFSGVYKQSDNLVIILDISAILYEERLSTAV